ncbi:transposase [Halorientalis persicus]|nr:transposase [Halorientalis persicus]
MWHRNATPVYAAFRAHCLRLIKQWKHETALHRYLSEKPFLATALGFDGIPSQDRLWKDWNRYFSEDDRELIAEAAEEIVNIARYRNVPAPDEVFRPDETADREESEPDSQSVRHLTREKTKEVWQHAKPFVTSAYDLQRGENADVHENAFWEGHAFIGPRAETCVNEGIESFAADTTRDRVQAPSTHRHHLSQLGVEDMRRMHRDCVSQLIERARRDSELVGNLVAAIDITKSNPYRSKGKLERDENGNVTNPWLLGYQNDAHESPQYYFQWASIQIVGQDIPLVLDALPVRRGMSRWEIVDELLEAATDIVDLDLVLLDREFDAEDVRDACETHEVHYLMPGRMDASERGTCTDLRRQGKLVHVESQRNLEYYSDGADTSRKEVYVPAMSADWSGDDLDAEPVEEDDDEESLRQELMSDFAETVDEDRERVGEMFSEVVDEVREEEEQQPTRGSAADARQYQLFKTNHPDIDAPGSEMDEIDTAQMVSGVLRHYRARWGIENGFKQIKSFRVRTTSMDHGYRLFNFLFASTLYNVWRLVDLLVKLELEDDPAHKPLVTADLFLTIAKQCFGLEPPD